MRIILTSRYRIVNVGGEDMCMFDQLIALQTEKDEQDMTNEQ